MLVPFIPIWEKKMFTNATFKIVSWAEADTGAHKEVFPW